MNEQFPKQHPPYKIINKNNIKVSYNNRILEKQKQQNKTPTKNCNYREEESCPLKGNCQNAH